MTNSNTPSVPQNSSLWHSMPPLSWIKNSSIRISLQALPTDPIYISFLENPKPCWSISSNSFLQHDNLIYIPDSNDLWLKVLHYKHDHILLSHPGQNKTASLILQDYTWPGLQEYVKNYCKSCTTCMHAKPQCHKPYGLLEQVLFPNAHGTPYLWTSLQPFQHPPVAIQS